MDHNEWIAAYGCAWRDKDDEGIAVLFTDDAIYRSSSTGTPQWGPRR